MKDKRKIQIGVIGDSQIRSNYQYEIAYESGREIALAGAILICGGRTGVMEAACKGVYDEGGISVGILPHDLSDPGVNDFLTIRIPTLLNWARNAIIPLASDGIIACGGNVGTLSELSFASLYRKPLVCITSISGWSKEIGKRGSLDYQKQSQIMTAETGKEAVQKILKAVSFSK